MWFLGVAKLNSQRQVDYTEYKLWSIFVERKVEETRYCPRIIFCLSMDGDCSWFVMVHNHTMRAWLSHVNETNLFKKVFTVYGILNDLSFLWVQLLMSCRHLSEISFSPNFSYLFTLYFWLKRLYSISVDL